MEEKKYCLTISGATNLKDGDYLLAPGEFVHFEVPFIHDASLRQSVEPFVPLIPEDDDDEDRYRRYRFFMTMPAHDVKVSFCFDYNMMNMHTGPFPFGTMGMMMGAGGSMEEFQRTMAQTTKKIEYSGKKRPCSFCAAMAPVEDKFCGNCGAILPQIEE